MPSAPHADRVPFRVAFVCTGNRARSPLAEAFLRAKVADESVRIESYGTLDLGPEPATPEAIAAASAFGIDIREHCARSLQGIRLDDVDLVVGFELIHVATAVVDAGAARERAFVLRELASLLEGFGPPAGQRDPPAIVALAHELRSPQPLSSFSVLDPHGRSQKTYLEVAGSIDSLTSTLATRLFGSVRERSSAHTGGPGAG